MLPRSCLARNRRSSWNPPVQRAILKIVLDDSRFGRGRLRQPCHSQEALMIRTLGQQPERSYRNASALTAYWDDVVCLKDSIARRVMDLIVFASREAPAADKASA